MITNGKASLREQIRLHLDRGEWELADKLINIAAEKAEKWDIYGLLAGGSERLNKVLDKAADFDLIVEGLKVDTLCNHMIHTDKWVNGICPSCHGTGFTTRKVAAGEVREFLEMAYLELSNGRPIDLKNGKMRMEK